MNPQYENLIEIDRKKIIGKQITEFLSDSQLPILTRTKTAQLGREYSRRNKGTIIPNRIPVAEAKILALPSLNPSCTSTRPIRTCPKLRHVFRNF
jgi:hypothetical protein